MNITEFHHLRSAMRDVVHHCVKKNASSLADQVDEQEIYSNVWFELVNSSNDFLDEQLICRLTYWRTIDHLRSLRRKYNCFRDLELDWIRGDDPEAETLQCSRELWDRVFAIVDSLPERQRLVASLYFELIIHWSERDIYQKLIEEVRILTGRTESLVAIKSAWHVARKKIRSTLSNLREF